MIKPNKFTDPKNCVIYNSYVILKLLNQHNRIECKKLYGAYIKKLGEEADTLFVPCLDFLFLLGKISYISDVDMLELNYEIK